MKQKGKVVVTGGAGFLGSHICRSLIQKEEQVVCVDNFVTGFRSNIKDLIENPLFELIEQDVSEGLDIPGKVAAVLHFASPASPPVYLSLPIETLNIGSYGTKNCLELAKANGSRFLLASTSEVYGDPLLHPQKESYWGNVNPIGPRSVYDEAKRFSEAMTMAYHRTYGLDTAIVRIFNTYGPFMSPDDGRVVSNFSVQALSSLPITIYGKGDQTRSFCYVEDEVEGILKLLYSDLAGPINIGNPNEFTILELAELILKLTNSDSRIIFQPLPQDDPTRRNPDISLAVSLLNWHPHTTLEKGIMNTLSYFESKLKERS